MSFHNVSLPEAQQYGHLSGFGFATIIKPTASGHEYRFARQAQARHRFRPLKELQSTEQAAELKEFALGRRGALHSFRLKDWLDYTSNADGKTAPTSLDQTIGVGDGTEDQFQLLKTYDVGGPNEYPRKIKLPVSGTVVAALNGTPTVAFTVSSTTGLITFNTPPGNGVVITAGYRFEVPVRFSANVDELAGFRQTAWASWSMDALECVEVLDETQWPETSYPGGSHELNVTGDLTMSFGDGKVQRINHNVGAGINAFLPAPDWLPCGGMDLLRLIVHASASGTVQLRDDSGTVVGSAISPGQTRYLDLLLSGGVATWQLS